MSALRERWCCWLFGFSLLIAPPLVQPDCIYQRLNAISTLREGIGRWSVQHRAVLLVRLQGNHKLNKCILSRSALRSLFHSLRTAVGNGFTFPCLTVLCLEGASP